MSDVRRVNVWINHKLNHGEEIQGDRKHGSHALMPWSEYERLQAVVDAARKIVTAFGDEPKPGCCDQCDLVLAIRALDGEPCQPR